MRKTVLALVLTLGLAVSAGQPLAGAQQQTDYQPGAPGAGDAYFPLDGNGGYDVQHYLLKLTYEPATDMLTGVAAIRSLATQDLSSFNLDLDGLTVRSITVNGSPATWTRAAGELTVTPRSGLLTDRSFTTVVQYEGVPKPIAAFGQSGFLHTDDGTLVVGEPHVAATWFPANDHPSDKATYTFRITVPKGLEAVANGILRDQDPGGKWTTWTWRVGEPMASYLATATIGEFDIDSYREDGIRYWDAIDTDLLDPVAMPHSGSKLAISHKADKSYKRLVRTISVPDGGAKLSFWVKRDTEPNWDYTLVEAHTLGEGDWTTLRDLNGHTSDDTGFVCPYWLRLHPFLAHYQSAKGGSCSPTGTTGKWWAVSGASDGWEQWKVDLSRYAGRDARVSISYVSDYGLQHLGVFVDDIVVSTGPGTTSFEDDGNTFDGWTVPGAPESSKPNRNDWTVGTKEDGPRSLGELAQASFGRHGEILGFLAGAFGPYPFSAAGGIVDDLEGLGFALENQTRPIYSKDFFYDPVGGDFVVVHELAHQWYGDSLAVAKWKHIWLNEGFATYAEWLWSEREELGTAQEIFDSFYSIPATERFFWGLTIGDPGPKRLFHGAVYVRGAMTLHRLRHIVGDENFFEILQRWTAFGADGNVTTGQFIKLAEEVSGKDLSRFFTRWLFKAKKPKLFGDTGGRAAPAAERPVPGSLRVFRGARVQKN